jgi:hypothetical protein
MTGPRGNRDEGDRELTCVVEMHADRAGATTSSSCRESVPRALRGGCQACRILLDADDRDVVVMASAAVRAGLPGDSPPMRGQTMRSCPPLRHRRRHAGTASPPGARVTAIQRRVRDGRPTPTRPGQLRERRSAPICSNRACASAAPGTVSTCSSPKRGMGKPLASIASAAAATSYSVRRIITSGPSTAQ